MTLLRISCLGSFQVTLDDQPITTFGTDKVRALLVYLVVESGQPHRRERLAGLLWSDQPEERALHNLRQALSTLRKALPAAPDASPYLLITPESIQFNSAAKIWLDVKAFNTYLDEALRHYQRHSTTGRLLIRRLRQGVALYQGHFLDEFALAGSPLFDEWTTLQREALHHRLVEGLTLLAEYHERRGEYALARQTASRLVELAPWDETAHTQLMRLLALDGQWSAAQAQYQALRRYLNQEMGLDPTPETTTLFERIRSGAAQNTPPASRYPPARHNLPLSPTPFIGREAELDEVSAALVDPQCRLLTLTGPGGIGKTRLALEAAREQVGVFADGVYFVSLTSVSTGDLIVPALAEALGFMASDRETPQTQLRDYLRGKNLLLVLDNFEHLLPPQTGGTILADILQAAPGVMLLVTSRERLNLREECLYALEGLAYPLEATPAPSAAETYSAIALFYDRARRIQRAFTPTPLETAAVIQICQLMDGLPLGVELAAAATWHQTCSEIAAHLAQGLDSLSSATANMPPRHRSLRAAFEVSWALLNPGEQAALSQLSVFRSGFESEAAQQVAQATSDTLAALLDQSLLRHTPAGRYEIHEAIRQFAADQLATQPQNQADALARHARYYARYLAEHNADLKGAGQTQALGAMRLESDNLRLAWRWLTQHQASAEIASSIDSLYTFYDGQSHFGEGIELLQAATGRLTDLPTAESALGRVLSRLGSLAERVGEYNLARAAANQSREIFERQPDKTELAFCLVILGRLAQRGGAYAEAQQLIQAALAEYQALSVSQGQANALFELGVVAYRLGHITEAKHHLEESLALSRQTGHPRRLAATLNSLADVLCHLGDYAQARGLFDESLKLSQELGDLYQVGALLNNLGTVDHVLGDYAAAETRYRQSLEIRREIGDRVGEAMTLGNLGELGCLWGNYAKSRQFAQQALEMGRALHDHWIIVANLNALAEAAYSEGRYAAAWPYLAEAAQLELETQTLQMLARTAVNAGGVLLKQGHTRLALEVLAATLHHPACQDDMRQKASRWLSEAGLTAPAQPSLSLEAAIVAALENR